MERITRSTKKRQLVFFLIAIFVFQGFIFALIFLSNEQLTVNYNNTGTQEDTTIDTIDEKQKEWETSAGINPNLTRTGYPFIIDNASTGLFDLNGALHGLHRDNIRIAYYSTNNEWVTIPFQIDERAFFRTYQAGLGVQAGGGLGFFCGDVDTIDLSNQIYYEYKHGYVGKHIDGTNTDFSTPWQYEEPTEWEANMSVYEIRQYETFNDNGALIDDLTSQKPNPTNFPGSSSNTATQEAAGMLKEQLEHRIDWDDELCFYAYNGKKASPYSWWNYNEYPNRYRVQVTDPVDGGQSWMYIYYNTDNTANPPTGSDANYYIPSEGPHQGEDHVSWDSTNFKISATSYEEQIDPNNGDLSSSLKIKHPGIGESRSLFNSMNKQYISMWFHIFFDDSNLCNPVDEQSDTEVWREGYWSRDATYYDEQINAIGYGLTCDFDLYRNGLPATYPGQDSDDTDGHRTNADVSGVSEEHSLDDTSHSIVVTATNADAADHDGDTGETVPYLRGLIDFGLEDNKAAIDGPCRVVLDKLSLQTVYADLGSSGPVGYEELYTVMRTELKYYSNLFQTEPTELDLNLMGEGGGDFAVELDANYAYMLGREYSSDVRADANSEIWMGQAPDNYTLGGNTLGFDKVPDRSRSNYYGNTWDANNPLYLFPDGTGGTSYSSEDYYSGGGPLQGTYTDTMATGSSPTTNPVPNWMYLKTSYGGAWSNMPYNDLAPLFSETQDLRMYWRDDASSTEMSFYGLNSDTNGATNEYQLRTVFGNLSYQDCLREYARQEYQLNDQLVITEEVFPGGPIFEDSQVYVNGQDPAGIPYVKNGDRVDIWLDMDNGYDTSLFSVDSSGLHSAAPIVDEFDTINHIFNVSFIIDTSNSDKVPPLSGYNVRITVNTAQPGYHDEELYLDNTAPDQATVTVTQPSLDEASAEVSWTGAQDNGRQDLIDHYDIYRNGTWVQTINDYSITSWLDTNVIAGNYYNYHIDVFDKVGHSTPSTSDMVYIDLQFNPAQPDALPNYFASTITLDWTDNPGDTGVISNYRAYWSESVDSGYVAFTDWLGSGGRTAVFDPQVEDTSPLSGTEYYFKIRCAGPVDIYSAPVSSVYDNSDPFAATITDLPDDYYPNEAEIPIQWSGAFDSLSGIGHYELYRNRNSAGWTQIPSSSYEFGPSEKTYTDTDITNGDYLQYYVSVYDLVGNGPVDSSIVSTTYHSDNVNPTANLWIESVSASKVAAETSETFDVTVTIKNTGGASGTVNSVSLDFSKGGTDVTSHFSPISDSTGWSVGISSSVDVTFTGVTADSTTPLGEMLIDASLTGDNNDNEADNKDTIWIRSYSDLIIADTYADSPLEKDSTNNLVSMNVTNTMITTTEITGYSIDFNGLTKGTDYTVNNPDVIGTQLSQGETVELQFIVSIATGASDGTYDVDYIINGTEVPTSLDVSNLADNAQTVTIGSADSDPPVFGTVSVSPNTGDPDAGTLITISVDVTDATGVAWVTADLIHPSMGLQDTISLSNTAGDTWSADWDCTSYPEGTYYSIDFATEDTLGNPATLVDGYTTLDIKDQTNPSVGTVTVTDPLEMGAIQTIEAQVTDGTGVQWVRAYVRNSAETELDNFLLYDDGTNGDTTAGDDIYTNTWDSSSPLQLEATGYNVDIQARDSSNAQNTQTYDNQAIFEIDDTTGPTISLTTITPDSGEVGQTFTITADITDYSGVSGVTAYVQTGSSDTPPTGTAITMYDDGSSGGDTAVDGTYTCQWDSTGQAEGAYFVDIRAFDGSDGSNSADALDIDNDITIGDSTPPTVDTVTVNPSSGDPSPTVGTAFTITAHVTDSSGVDEVWADIELGDENLIASIQLLDPQNDDTYEGTWDSSGSSTGTYDIDIRANDTSLAANLNDYQSGVQFDLIDNTLPSIANVQVSDDPLELGNIQLITAEVSDFSGISSVTALVQDASTESNVATLTMYDDGSSGGDTAIDGTYTCQWDSTGDILQNYVVDIEAEDASSGLNQQTSDNAASFTLQDTTAPTLSAESINPDAGEIGQVFTITVDANDLSGIQSITAYIQTGSTDVPPTGTAMTMYDDGTNGDATAGDDIYTCQWDSTGQTLGTYYVDIRAIDNSGSSNTAEIYDIDNNISIQDVTAPSVSNVNVNPSIGDPTSPTGQSFTISAQVVDNYNVDEVWADIELGDENLIRSIILTDPDTNNVYEGTFDSTGEALGTYTIDIRANDTSNNENDFQSGVNFNLEDNTAPVIIDLNVDQDPLEFGQIITINVTITEEYGINWVRAYLEDGSAITDFLLYDDGVTGSDKVAGDNVYTNTWDSTIYDESTINIDIRAQDNNANEGFEDNLLQFTVVDTTNPNIVTVNVNPSSGDPTLPGQVFTITAQVTDISGINWVRAYLEDGSAITDFLLYDDGSNGDVTPGDGTYTNTWDASGMQETTINIDITAEDNANTANSDTSDNAASFDLIDSTVPTIQNIIVNPNAGQQGTNFIITADISDLSGILTAYATIENGSFIETITLVDDGSGVDNTASDGTYSGAWDSTPYTNGTYNVDVNATDNSAAQNFNSVDNADQIEIYIADETAPSITNVQVNPNFANTGTIVTISALITDASGIFTPNVTITGASWSQTFDLTDPDTDDIWTYDWDTSGRADGTYDIGFNATDQSENYNVRYLQNVETVTVSNDPIVSNVQVSDDPLELGNIQTITCYVFDNDGLQSVIAYVESPDETIIDTLTMYDDGTNGDVTSGDNTWTAQWDSTGNSLDTYYIDIAAEDVNTNTNSIDNGTEFILQDTQGPSLSGASISPDAADLETVFDISVTATDFSGIKNMTAIISLPDEANNFTVILTDPDTNDVYTGQWDSVGQPEGTYTVDILGYDTIENSRELENIDNDIVISDQTAPAIGAVVASPSNADPEAGDIITITADAADLSGILSVTAFIQDPSETTIRTLTLYDDGTHGDVSGSDGVFTNTWDSSGQAESINDYYIDVRATDDSSNQNQRYDNNAETFQIRDTTLPQTSNIQVSDDLLELGNTQLITCDVSDYSGILSVTATVQSGAYSTVVSLVDDGTGGDATSGDGKYSGQWDSTGRVEGNYTIDIDAIDNSIAQNLNTIINGTDFLLIDSTIPSITNVQVSPNTVDPEAGDIVTITADISDLSGILSAYATIENGTWSTVIPLVDDGTSGDATSGDGTYTCQWNSYGYSEDSYNIDVNATDNGVAQNKNFRNDVSILSLADSTLPSISNVQISDNTLELGDIQTISAIVTDMFGISSVTAFVQNASTGTTITTLTMYDDGTNGDVISGDGNFTCEWNSFGDNLGNYVIDIRARDNSIAQNEQYSDNAVSFALDDTIGPIITNIIITDETFPVNEHQIGDNFTITIEVSDFSGIQSGSVIAHIQRPNEQDNATLTMYDDGTNGHDNTAGDGIYTCFWDTSTTNANEGTYYIDIEATDASVNTNTVEEEDIDTLLLGDTTAPTVSNINAEPDPADPEYGDIIQINCTVTDASPIKEVYAGIRNDAGVTIAIVQLTEAGAGTLNDDIYGNTWDCSGYPTGNYYVDINATDDSINNNTNYYIASSRTFILEDNTGPEITNVNVSPLTLELGDLLTITCSVSDFSGISFVRAIIDLSVNATVNLYDDGNNGDVTAGDGIYSGQWDSQIATGQEGSIDITIEAEDNAFNRKTIYNVASFTLEDTTAPIISNIDATPNVDAEIGVTNISISAQVTDLSGINEVWATILNSSTSEWMASIQLSNIGGNNYAGEWNSTGFNPGNYSLRLNASDNALASNLASSDWTQDIELINPIPEVGLAILDAPDGNVILNSTKGGTGSYFAGDSVTFVFGIQVNKTDIRITNIYINEFTDGTTDYSDLFTLVGTNITGGLPFDLNQGTVYTYIELTYSIDGSAGYTTGIEPTNLIIEYEDQDQYSYPPLSSARTFISINLYENPVISAVEIDNGETTQYVSYPNTIEFQVTATHLSNYYRAFLNLTAWNNTDGRGWIDGEYPTVNTIYEMTWDSAGYYKLDPSIDNFLSGDYYGHEINVILTTAIPNIENKSVTTSFTDDFTVDGNNPIIREDQVAVYADLSGTPLTIFDPDSIEQFYVFANITDDPIGQTGIDISTTRIEIEDGIFYFDHNLGNGIHYAIIDLSEISSGLLDIKNDSSKGVIRFDYLYAYDLAGNEASLFVRNYTMDLTDTSKPSMNFDNLKIGDLGEIKGELSLPANEYIEIKLDASDNNLGRGVMEVRLIYTINNGEVNPSSDDGETGVIYLSKVGEYYIGVLSPQGQVGFSENTEIEIWFEIEDFNGNVYNSVEDGDFKIKIKFTGEMPVFGMIVILGALASFLGAIVFRIAFYRKKALIVDVDSKLMKKTMKK